MQRADWGRRRGIRCDLCGELIPIGDPFWAYPAGSACEDCVWDMTAEDALELCGCMKARVDEGMTDEWIQAEDASAWMREERGGKT